MRDFSLSLSRCYSAPPPSNQLAPSNWLHISQVCRWELSLFFTNKAGTAPSWAPTVKSHWNAITWEEERLDWREKKSDGIRHESNQKTIRHISPNGYRAQMIQLDDRMRPKGVKSCSMPPSRRTKAQILLNSITSNITACSLVYRVRAKFADHNHTNMDINTSRHTERLLAW